MRAAIVSGVDAPPVLELGEHVFDAMALTVGSGLGGLGLCGWLLTGCTG